MLPSPTSTKTKTNQTVENYTLKSGRIYKMEVWGAKGGNANSNNRGNGGNGSHAVGWYDMRSSANATASIFAGGLGSSTAAGWGATSISSSLTGTPGGSGNFSGDTGANNGGGGGGASGVYVGVTALIVAGGGGGGGSGASYILDNQRWGGNGGGQNGGNGYGNTYGMGGTQTSHGAGGGTASGGSASGGGSGAIGGGGAGGGYTQGFAGGGTVANYGSAGGGSGGSSYIGGVQSLKDTAGKASTTWAESTATGNGKVVITEYIMAVNVASPTSTDDYLVSAPSKTSALFGESYTFTITREIGVGDIGLNLNTANGSLELTSADDNVFTYTVSNVQGQINANDFSVTIYNIEAPPDNIVAGYTISNLSTTTVLKGGSYSFIVNLENGYAVPKVSFSGNGKLSYSSVDISGNLTVTISNVQAAITASNFTVTVSKAK